MAFADPDTGFEDVGPLFQGLLNFYGQERANDANAQQARLNRKFQERMSNTAHFREVLDLRRAGLNPILSATGGSGASTPSGSTAQMENSIGAGLNAYQTAASGTSSRNLQSAQVKSTDAQTKLTNETTANQGLIRDQIASQTQANQATALNQTSQAELNSAATSRVNQQIKIESPKAANADPDSGWGIPRLLKRGGDLFNPFDFFR